MRSVTAANVQLEELSGLTACPGMGRTHAISVGFAALSLPAECLVEWLAQRLDRPRPRMAAHVDACDNAGARRF